MHDHDDVDFDWCDDDIDIPELSDDAAAEIRGTLSASLAQRLDYNADSADEPTAHPEGDAEARQDRVPGEGASATSPGAGPRLAQGRCDAEKAAASEAGVLAAWLGANAFDRRTAAAQGWAEACLGPRRRNDKADDEDYEQTTTIVVQVKHTRLTEQALAQGAAEALASTLNDLPITAAVKAVLGSLYSSIAPASTSVLLDALDEFAVEETESRGQEHSGPDVESKSRVFSRIAEILGSPDLDCEREQTGDHPRGSFGRRLKIGWPNPVTDVDIVVALQSPPDPSAQDQELRVRTSQEPIDYLRSGIQNLGLALNDFPRSDRKPMVAGHRPGDDPFVVVTGDLCNQ